MATNHRYEEGINGCSHVEEGIRCGKRAKHLMHKSKKIKMYPVGETVGRYVVSASGAFIKIKE